MIEFALLLAPAIAAGVLAQKLRGRIGLFWGGGVAVLVFAIDFLAGAVLFATGLGSPVGLALSRIGYDWAAITRVSAGPALMALAIGADLMGDVLALLAGLTAMALILTLPKVERAGMGQAATVSTDLRDCPHCAEPIRPAAKVCRHCGRDATPAAPPRPLTAAERARADRAFPAPDLEALARRPGQSGDRR